MTQNLQQNNFSNKALWFILAIFAVYVPDYLAVNFSFFEINFITVSVVLEAITLYLLFYLLNHYRNQSLVIEQEISPRSRFVKLTVLWYVALVLVGGIAASLIGSGDTENQELLKDVFQGSPVVSYFMFTVIAGPILEELTIRKILMGHVFGANYLGVVLSAFIFGLLHVQGNFVEIVPYAALGLVLGFVYKKYQSITLNIAIHILNNFVAFVAICCGA